MAKTTIATLCLLFTCVACSSLIPTQLTVDYLTEPQAVDSLNPALGWILQPILAANGEIPQNQTQKAYQILVASSKELISTGKPDLWDSDRVESDRTFDVWYQGKVLTPGQTVFWTVRVWDQNNEVSAYAKVRN